MFQKHFEFFSYLRLAWVGENARKIREEEEVGWRECKGEQRELIIGHRESFTVPLSYYIEW